MTPTSTEKQTPPAPPVGLKVYQRILAADDGLRRANQARLREMYAAHAGEVTVFSAHDASELAALA